MYKIKPTRRAKKDAEKIEQSKLKPQVDEIMATVKENPYKPTQGFEKLTQDLKGAYSRCINKQYRFVYTIEPNYEGLRNEMDELYKGVIKVVSMWTH